MDQSKIRACIRECLDAVATCEECADRCMGDAQMQNCLRLCLDCAEICQACARVMARRSPLSGLWCQFCADVCDACAAECEKYDDDLMRRCAETCRRSAQLCREVAAV